MYLIYKKQYKNILKTFFHNVIFPFSNFNIKQRIANRKLNQRRSKEVVAFANKFYLSNKKDGRVVFHCGGDIIASFNYYPADILCDALYDISTSFERMLPLQGFYIIIK